MKFCSPAAEVGLLAAREQEPRPPCTACVTANWSCTRFLRPHLVSQLNGSYTELSQTTSENFVAPQA